MKFIHPPLLPPSKRALVSPIYLIILNIFTLYLHGIDPFLVWILETTFLVHTEHFKNWLE